jgi:hypothetical protein
MIGVREQNLCHDSPQIFTRRQIQHAVVAFVRARRIHASGTLRPMKRSLVRPVQVVVAELSTQCHPLAIGDLSEIQLGGARPDCGVSRLHNRCGANRAIAGHE